LIVIVLFLVSNARVRCYLGNEALAISQSVSGELTIKNFKKNKI